eukprot:5983860-Prymnesium_polylepis.1
MPADSAPPPVRVCAVCGGVGILTNHTPGIASREHARHMGRGGCAATQSINQCSAPVGQA